MCIDDIAAYADRVAGADVDVRGAPSSLLRPSIEIENFLRTGRWGDYSGGGVIGATASTPAGLKEYNETSGHPAAYLFKPFELEDPAHGAVLDNRVYRPGHHAGRLNADWRARPDASCLAAGRRTACIDPMAVLLGYVDTPLFVNAQTADHLARDLNAFFAFAPGGNTIPGRRRLVYHPTDADERVRAAVQRLDERNRGHGAFVVPTDDHMALTDDRKLARTIGGLALVHALYNWVVATRGTERFCVSRGRPGPQTWFHVTKKGANTYVDLGADPAHPCPGATF